MRILKALLIPITLFVMPALAQAATCDLYVITQSPISSELKSALSDARFNAIESFKIDQVGTQNNFLSSVAQKLRLGDRIMTIEQGGESDYWITIWIVMKDYQTIIKRDISVRATSLIAGAKMIEGTAACSSFSK